MNKIPGWLLDHQKQVVLRQRKVRERAAAEAALAFPIRDSFAKARGWRMSGQPTFTCIPDSEHPWNPEVIKAIWKFDPTIVPVWAKYVMIRSGDDSSTEIEILGRHVVARHVENLVEEAVPFRCDMPTMPCNGLTFKKPNVLLFQVEANEGVTIGGIGPYADFDWEIYDKLLQTHLGERTAQEVARAMREAKENRILSAKAKHDEEDLGRRKELQTFVDKKLEQVSELELKEHFMGEKEPETKPFVQVGTTPAEA